MDVDPTCTAPSSLELLWIPSVGGGVGSPQPPRSQTLQGGASAPSKLPEQTNKQTGTTCSLIVPLEHGLLYQVAGDTSEHLLCRKRTTASPRLTQQQLHIRLALNTFSAESLPFWGVAA